MTVYETMEMFAKLRGIKKNLINRTCTTLIELLDLKEHKGKMCYTLSGGKNNLFFYFFAYFKRICLQSTS
jgi:ABC-type multidrug transport system ATPase subunit